MIDEIVVAQIVHVIEWELSAGDLRCEISQISDLLSRHSHRPHRLVARREHQLGRGCVVREECIEAAQNGSRRLARQLLVDDRANQRLEVRAFRAKLESAGAHNFDYPREDRVDSLEVPDRCAVVGHADNLRAGRSARFAFLAPLSSFSR